MDDEATSDCANNKHQITPMKMKTKASRSKYNEDVHTLSSSPATPPQTNLSRSPASSPRPSSIAHAYYRDLCSQDLPEVIWDYSPKHRQDRNSGKKLLVIDDLLKYSNLFRNQPEKAPFVDSQTLRDLQLLEKWMEVKNPSPPVSPCAKAKVIKKRISKKRTGRLLREIQAMLKAEQEENASNSTATSSTNSCQKLPAGEHVIESNSTNCDDDDDIWGSGNDNDDYILVKATQEVESRLMNFKSGCNDKLVNDTCMFKTVVPEIVGANNLFYREHNENSMSSLTSCKSNFYLEKSLFSNADKVSSVNVNTFGRKKMDNETFTSENTWDNEFDDSLEPETFSSIPDDVLMGKTDESVSLVQTSINNSDNTTNSIVRDSEILVNNTELYEDSDDPFNDGLNEEDISAWADQTESMFSIKCTPEEIEHKKEVAMQKLQLKKTKN